MYFATIKKRYSIVVDIDLSLFCSRYDVKHLLHALSYLIHTEAKELRAGSRRNLLGLPAQRPFRCACGFSSFSFLGETAPQQLYSNPVIMARLQMLEVGRQSRPGWSPHPLGHSNCLKKWSCDPSQARHNPSLGFIETKAERKRFVYPVVVKLGRTRLELSC